MISKINLPFHKIHHIEYSYGRLIMPWWKNQKANWWWLAKFASGWKIISPYDFHNCTLTGKY